MNTKLQNPFSVACGLLIVAITAVTLCSCKKNAPPPPTASQKLEASSSTPEDFYRAFSGEKAMEHVRKQVQFGPRPSGSPGIERGRKHIEAALTEAGWTTERQTFKASVAPGLPEIEFVNIVARYSKTKKPAPKTTQKVILCSHYDTKNFKGTTFVGANDAASSTAGVLEAARVLATVPVMAEQVELVFFDGEEAVVSYTETDGLVGSRFYASDLRDSNRAKQFKCAVLWDMIGDADFTITLPADSPKQLAAKILESAEILGVRKHFDWYNNAILDDHKILEVVALIPSIDLIDFDYLYWHTGGDTIDKVSPESIQITGQVTLHFFGTFLKK